MALSGSAFLALWNDIDADIEAQYERWHTQEHVPERVGIPGFLTGRRYRSDAPGQPRYFTLYDVAQPAVFESAAYLDVIERPTAWSAAMRPRLRNVVRSTCDTQASVAASPDDARAICCVRFSCASGATADAPDAPDAPALLAACAAWPGVVAVHLGAARDSVPAAFRRWSGASGPSHVLLIEADSEATLRDARAALDAVLAAHAGLDVQDGTVSVDTYTLVFRIEHAAVDASLRRAGVAPREAQATAAAHATQSVSPLSIRTESK